MYKIIEVTALPDYRLQLKYHDGVKGVVDVSHLVGKGVFALWKDYEAFCNVTIGLSGELLWGDEVDLCPDSLYLKLTGKSPEELFPHLRQDMAHA